MSVKVIYSDGIIKNLSSFDDIDEPTDAKELCCINNQLTSLKGIRNLYNLTKLYFGGNKVNSLKDIENLSNLKYLYCSDNKITSLKGIERLTNLKELYCGFNQLTSLSEIEKMSKMISIYCCNNQLTSLKGIEKLYNLKRLYCSCNNLTSLKELKKLSNLERLCCGYNQVISLTGIENLYNLESVKLILIYPNPIYDYIKTNYSDNVEKYIKDLKAVEQIETWFLEIRYSPEYDFCRRKVYYFYDTIVIQKYNRNFS